MSDLLILLTNDDGFDAPGITSLKNVLSKFATVYIVAPHKERSTTGQSLSLHVPLRVKEESKNVFSVTGFPADCVYIGLSGNLLPRKPDFVISGINKGANMGTDVYYSGTVAASRQSLMAGVPSICVSLFIDGRKDVLLWDDAAEFCLSLLKKVQVSNIIKDSFLSINYPNILKKDIKGVKVTGMGQRMYSEEVLWRTDPRGEKYCWIGGSYNGFKPAENSDCAAIDDGYISVTPIKLDTTNYDVFDDVKAQLQGVF